MYAPPRVFHGILFYALIMSAIVVYRPKMLFSKEDGSPIPFGTGSNKTVFDLGTVASVSAIASFAMFALVDIVAPHKGV
jgi:hypothetical protein